MNLHLIRFALLVAMIVAIVGVNVAFGNAAAVDSHASATCIDQSDHNGVDSVPHTRRHVASEAPHAATVNWKRILPGVLR